MQFVSWVSCLIIRAGHVRHSFCPVGFTGLAYEIIIGQKLVWLSQTLAVYGITLQCVVITGHYANLALFRTTVLRKTHTDKHCYCHWAEWQYDERRERNVRTCFKAYKYITLNLKINVTIRPLIYKMKHIWF